MADVLIEHGIGETRAAVLDADGAIVEAHIERPGLRCGDVYALRVRRPERGRSHAEINHEAVVLDAAGLGDGTLVRAEVVREVPFLNGCAAAQRAWYRGQRSRKIGTGCRSPAVLTWQCGCVLRDIG